MLQRFIQDPPQLQNQYDTDRLLRLLFLRHFPRSLRQELEPGLRALGARAVDELLVLGRQAELNPPRHVPFDPWGHRIDQIEVSAAWKALERIAAEEGLVATGYERREGELSRLNQFARLYLYGPSSAIFTCPLAMTDGAARALELYGSEAQKTRALPHLLSRDPAQFWTSGQWMTEKTGGSDVSRSETVARWDAGTWRLYGEKWFTSAVTAHMAMTLARIEGHPEGSRGLSLFYLEIKDAAGAYNGLTVQRLKDKLGTRALPTAELTLTGTRAELVGGEGHGVRKIASLFNITRIYNAVCAVAFMRRSVALARAFAHRRVAFGKPLSQLPLHLETLAEMQLELSGAFHLVFHLGLLLGREECGTASEEETHMLRLLTPITKLYTARQGIQVTSELLECFGGTGYCEDSGLPQIHRDAQVLSIWEGTTNVLSLDTLRAMFKEGAFGPWLGSVERRLEGLRMPVLKGLGLEVQATLPVLRDWITRWKDVSDGLDAGARALAFSLARIQIALLLLEQAEWSAGAVGQGGMGDDGVETRAADADLAAARRWIQDPRRPLLVLEEPTLGWRQDSSLLALG